MIRPVQHTSPVQCKAHRTLLMLGTKMAMAEGKPSVPTCFSVADAEQNIYIYIGTLYMIYNGDIIHTVCDEAFGRQACSRRSWGGIAGADCGSWKLPNHL